MTEGEIYRKSGESEAIGSISGNPLEKIQSPDSSETLDYLAYPEKEVEQDTGSKTLGNNPETAAELLIHGKARFSVSKGNYDRPFAERIRKLRSSVASIMESLSSSK